MSNKLRRRLDLRVAYASRRRRGCGCLKALERPRCTVEHSALSESWALYCRRLATTPLLVLAVWTPASKEFTAFDAHRRLVPYNASNQASRARQRRLHEPGTGSLAPETSRRRAARARPRLVSNNALSQLEPAKPQGGTVVHAGSPCDAASWAPCDRPHRQPGSDAAAQQDLPAAPTGRSETLAARVGRVSRERCFR